MNTLAQLSLSISMIVFLFSGCVIQPLGSSNPSHCPSIQTPPTQSVVHIARLQDSTSAPVVALDFATEQDELTSVYASKQDEAGQVIVWNIKAGEIIQQRSIEWIHPYLTSISTTGDILATVEDRQKMAEQYRHKFDSTEGVNEFVEIWNVMTGEQQKLFPFYYTAWIGPAINAIHISPDGRHILEISERTVSLDSTDPDVERGGESIHSPVSSEDPDYTPSAFVVGVFDQKGKSFAIGVDRGAVLLQKLSGKLRSEEAGSLSPLLEYGKRKPLALAFDASGNWLAILRTNSLELRNLRSWVTYLWPPFSALWPSCIVSDLPAAETAKLAFNARGDVLAIGTSHGWQLRRNSDLTLLAEQTNVVITSLAFSDDGRYIAFGEASGAVQVWSLTP